MMITIDSYYFFMLIAANVLLLSISSLSIAKFERRCRRIEEFWDSPTGTALSDDEVSSGMYEQIIAIKRLEARLGELQRAMKVMQIKAPREQQASVAGHLPIENAVRMAKHGASIEDLTRSCGLNIGEARLMQKLHGSSRLAATGH